jgi:hypothetical protein
LRKKNQKFAFNLLTLIKILGKDAGVLSAKSHMMGKVILTLKAKYISIGQGNL